MRVTLSQVNRYGGLDGSLDLSYISLNFSAKFIALNLHCSFNALITASLTISIAEFIHIRCTPFARFGLWVALQVFSKVFKHVLCPAVALNCVLNLVLCAAAQQLILFVILVLH